MLRDADYMSTDEDEEEKAFRLKRKEGKSAEEIAEMNKTHNKLYTVMFNIFQVKS